MPMFEMPMKELKEYTGINPEPSDFNDYWKRAINEMKGVKAQVELKKSDFQTTFAECYDLFFTGVKGARIHAKYLKPINIETLHPAVIQFHGYTGNSGDWSNKLGYVARGFSVFAMDCRGQGGLSEDTGGVKGNTYCGHIIRGLDDDKDNLLFRQIFLDTVQLANIVMNMPEVDENKVAVMGLSQGGGLTLACASLEPRIKKVVSMYPFLSDYKRVWEMDLAKNAYQELTDYFRRFDPRHQREENIFTKLGYIDIQNLVNRIKGDVLMGTGLMDQICPPSTQFATYNKIKSPKKMLIYPDFGHENLPDFNDFAFQFLSDL